MDTTIGAREVVGHFIGGAEMAPAAGRGGRSGPVYDPSTGEVARHVAFAERAEVEAAVSAAKSAFDGWSKTPPVRRARVLFNYLALVRENRDALARIITSEHGKTIADALGEIDRGIEIIEFACGIPQLLIGGYSQQAARDIDAWTVRQPLGVVVGITSFNFPMMVPTWMYPLAIAAGNTFVLKPSERDPSASLVMARLLKQAGLPDGVFNVIQGDKVTAAELLQHPDVAAVSFVGSTPIAQAIHQECARTGKRVQALGGAKNHMVVMPDADIDQAIEALLGAAFGSAGERCMAVSVAVLVGNVAERLLPRLTERTRRLRVGRGADPATEMGPLITPAALQRVRDYIAGGIEEGAQCVVDGRDAATHPAGAGFFIGATVFDHVAAHMRIYKDEIFGPVLACMRVPSLDAAIALINQNEFGNGAICFTQDGASAREFAAQVNIGMLGINVPVPVPMAWFGFGGWNRSMFGDLHAYGSEGIRFYTKQKSVMQRWPREPAPAQFAMPSAH